MGMFVLKLNVYSGGGEGGEDKHKNYVSPAYTINIIVFYPYVYFRRFRRNLQ